MNRYSVLAIALAIVVGGVVGFMFSTSQNNKSIVKLKEEHKKELLKENEKSKIEIEKSLKRIEQLNNMTVEDSLKILSLEHKIEQDGVKIQKLRKDILKLTPDEKVAFIIDRYSK